MPRTQEIIPEFSGSLGASRLWPRQLLPLQFFYQRNLTCGASSSSQPPNLTYIEPRVLDIPPRSLVVVLDFQHP